MKKIEFLVLTLCFVIKSIESKKTNKVSSDCNNPDLTIIGCSCTHRNLVSKQCPNGFMSIKCDFPDEDIVNYFYYAVELLSDSFSQSCWYSMEFSNVILLSQESFKHLTLKSLNDFEIRLNFYNLKQIEAYAFDSIKLSRNDSLIISIKNRFTNVDILQIDKNAFSNLKNVKLLEFNDFRLGLNLTVSHFNNSKIQTLEISNSKFSGFFVDPETNEHVKIENLIIKNSFLNRIDEFALIPNLKSITIRNSGVSSLSFGLFQFGCENLKYLDLSFNLIKKIENVSFIGLEGLDYLSLENNPIEFIDQNAFLPFSSSLTRLNLKSTHLRQFSFDFSLNYLKEIDFSFNFNLEPESLRFILTSTPNLEYLNLEESGLIKKSKNLNSILDLFETELTEIKFKSLKYIDLTSSESIYFDDLIFLKQFNKENSCLWNKILRSTLIKVNQDHECSCPLIYLYKNLLNYYLPFNQSFIQLDFNSSQTFEILSHILPRCYFKMLIQDLNFDRVRRLEKICGINPDDLNLNCTKIKTTTSVPTTTVVTSTTSIFRVRTTSNGEEDLYIRKKIISKYTLPLMLSGFSLSVLIIVLIFLKTKYDYTHKFLNIYKKNFREREPKEMDHIVCISPKSYAINVPDTDRILTE